MDGVHLIAICDLPDSLMDGLDGDLRTFLASLDNREISGIVGRFAVDPVRKREVGDGEQRFVHLAYMGSWNASTEWRDIVEPLAESALFPYYMLQQKTYRVTATEAARGAGRILGDSGLPEGGRTKGEDGPPAKKRSRRRETPQTPRASSTEGARGPAVAAGKRKGSSQQGGPPKRAFSASLRSAGGTGADESAGRAWVQGRGTPADRLSRLLVAVTTQLPANEQPAADVTSFTWMGMIQMALQAVADNSEGDCPTNVESLPLIGLLAYSL
ncbi:hypothetical protein KFL_009190020 [Klebsormidium nitens]|uniref:Uncharacterized protein n=1 Tax=Klebsormidium nitens TaxID=105231 RepID=A0A1Y1IPV7_KLENI|nr:hypothetical protein KFL_009190020 [Klebsormidium nitens]|eukprot:GAQ92082.1 hypothetical protein KFL_009190020 [Klebsormidium nitens]